jgi:hypothetical protein
MKKSIIGTKWEAWEDAILQEFYRPERKSLGLDVCVTKLPHRTRHAIQDRARKIGIALSKSDPVASFFKKVQLTPGCWLWKGGADQKGYGYYKWKGQKLGAHRVSYFIHFETLDPQTLVCHRCDNPRCVNPDHLFAGSHADNVHDMVAKNRHPRLTGYSGRAKLSEKDELTIQASHLRNCDLAAQFGVDPSLISRIRHGRVSVKAIRGGASDA